MKLLVRNPQTDEVEIWDRSEQFKTLADNLKQWRTEGLRMRPPKFVVMAKDGENYLVIFGESKYHDQEAKLLQGYTFVAAGRWQVSDKPDAYYRSDTCMITFGHDRPDGFAAQDTLLADIELTLKAIFEACR